MDEYKITMKDFGDFDMYELKCNGQVMKRDDSLYTLLDFAKNALGLKTVEVLGVERYIGGVEYE